MTPRAPRRLPTRAEQRYMVATYRDAIKRAQQWAPRLEAAFKELGASAAAAYRAVGSEDPPVSDPTKALGDFTPEQLVANFISMHGRPPSEREVAQLRAARRREVQRVLDRMNAEAWQKRTIAKQYAATYTEIAHSTVDRVGTLGIAFGNVPAIVQATMREGAARVKLVNISVQSERAIMRAIADGRAKGEGPPAIERRIRGYVESGGPTANVSARAMRIARTETMHAIRYSQLSTYQAGPFQTVVMYDNRLGGFTDADCEARDDVEVPFDVAEQAMEDEHPNGTLSFAPGSLSPTEGE